MTKELFYYSFRFSRDKFHSCLSSVGWECVCVIRSYFFFFFSCLFFLISLSSIVLNDSKSQIIINNHSKRIHIHVHVMSSSSVIYRQIAKNLHRSFDSNGRALLWQYYTDISIDFMSNVLKHCHSINLLLDPVQSDTYRPSPLPSLLL